LECGSGESTVVFAKYLSTRRASLNSRFQLISLEQNPDWIDIRARLEHLDLATYVKILHAPLSKKGLYLISEQELREALNGTLVDWIFIDGPAGPDGCRRWTLPLLERFAQPGARWFLDDAFRDGELQCLREWQQTERYIVRGIWPIGKGLAEGSIKSCGTHGYRPE
jgi:hypothetical protein